MPIEYLYSPGVILFKIDIEYFLQDFPSSEKNLLITDLSGQLLVHHGYLFDALHPAQDFVKSNGESGNQMVFKKMLDNYNLAVYLTIDRDRFYQPLYNSITAFLGLILFVTIVGLFLSYVLARKSFLPIYMLVKKLGVLGEPYFKGKRNELELLDKTFEQLREERDNFAGEMLEERVLVRNHLLMSIIYGNFPDMKTRYMKEFWNELTSGKCSFCVVVALIDNYPQFVKTHNAKEQWLIKYNMCNTFETHCEAFGNGYALNSALTNGIAGIIRCQSDKNAGLEAFSVCQKLRQTVKNNSGFSITCAIGPSVQDTATINYSYFQAFQYAKYRFFLGRDTIITSELAVQFEASRGKSPEELNPFVEKLLCKIKSGDAFSIRPAIEQIFTDINNEKQIVSFNFAFFDILSVLNRMVRESIRDKKDSFLSKLDVLYENRFETIADAIDTLVYFCEELSIIFTKLKKEPAGKDIFPHIIKFIEENYSNPNLNLPVIAEKMSLNPSYLTRSFKAKYGIPLMQYIDQFRFEKSKELLKKTEYSIRRIVETVGYFDENNFMRKFKKIEGISPSQFRNIHKTQVNMRG